MKVVTSNFALAGLAGGILFVTAAAYAPSLMADEVSNPYLTIVDRNPFRLNPPPPPPSAPEPPPPDLPTVIFSGTITIGTETKAMFALKPTAPKAGRRGEAPPAAAEETHYISLRENETEDQVQLLKIHPGGEEVDIINAGTKVTLNMKENGFAKSMPAGPSNPGLPGARGGMPGGPIMPAGQPAPAGGGGGVNLGAAAPVPGAGGLMTGGGPAFSATHSGISVGGQGGQFASANQQVNVASVMSTFNQRPPGSPPPAMNTGGLSIGNGNGQTATPIAPPISAGGNGQTTLPFNAPNLGSPNSIQPNNTPANTVVSPIMPPTPKIN